MGRSLTDERAIPVGLAWRSHAVFIIATISIGLFSETFLYGVIVPVLPFILEDRIEIRHDDLQIYSSILLAVFAGSSALFSPFAGLVADRLSSKRAPFMAGLLMLMASTILFFTGQTVAVLVVARCAQGASSGLIWTTGFAMCVDTVGPNDMGKTLGIVMSFVNIGALLSPPIGGIVYDQAGVLGVLVVPIGVLVIDLIMQLLLVEKKVAVEYIHKPLASENGSSVNICERANCINEEPSPTEDSPLLGDVDKIQDYYIMPTQNQILKVAPILLCLRNPSLIVAITICGVQWALVGAFDSTVPLEANDLFMFNSLQSGLLFIPVSCGRLIAGPLAGWTVDRYGPKPVAVLGFSFLVPVLLLFRLVGAEPRNAQIALYSALLALCGIGIAIVDTPGFVDAHAIIEKYHKCNPKLFGDSGGFASLCGVTLMAFGLGMAFGPLLAGGLRDRVGYGNMNAVFAGVAAVSAIASLLWLGGKPARLWNK